MNEDLARQEDDDLQSYARKGMAQELAKKLGLFADVPGADTDEPNGDEPQGDGTQAPAQDDIDPALLEQILRSQ